jgi:hypothetical protein
MLIRRVYTRLILAQRSSDIGASVFSTLSLQSNVISLLYSRLVRGSVNSDMTLVRPVTPTNLAKCSSSL